VKVDESTGRQVDEKAVTSSGETHSRGGLLVDPSTGRLVD